jgi:hypothetical protein
VLCVLKMKAKSFYLLVTCDYVLMIVYTQHTLRICNIYCFPTAKIVTLTRLTVKVYTYIACLVFVVALYFDVKNKSLVVRA